MPDTKRIAWTVEKEYLESPHLVRDHYIFFTPKTSEEKDLAFLLADDDFIPHFTGKVYESALEILLDWGAGESGTTLLFGKVGESHGGEKRYALLPPNSYGERKVVQSKTGPWRMIIG